MKKAKTDLSLILPHRVVAPKGALIEHQSVGDSGILDPNRLLKAIMDPYDWEKVFRGIRTTMSRWEYCILRYFSGELDETNWSNVLHNLSRNMQDCQESSIYYPSARRGLGPGSRSYLRKNSREYYVIFEKYFGPFTKDELKIGESFSSRMHRFAKALIQHGRNGRRLLEKNSRTYHQKSNIDIFRVRLATLLFNISGQACYFAIYEIVLPHGSETATPLSRSTVPRYLAW